ncbi:unnamed protein product [Rotaria sp. Silwood2]|nr:unnamed protein product [Rotaria sp. Silwood2]CAF3200307.1 unnamed protein product [Rotaria sp. Silwood2]CAF3248208.1 unnamed protein product [Rotaria sp. Silwood2]CAF4084423.1 unnamed protein product [Rotaria sp. Silwood2]CAF4194036.1 unnamed protein product [Rotaria sp. Silwood2]
MQAACSSTYLQQTLQKAFEYFCRIQEKNLTSDDKDKCLDCKSISMVHNSYELFTQCLHSSIALDTKINQKQVRKLCVQTFDKKRISLPEPKLKLTRSTWLLWLNKNVNEDEIEYAFRPYFENNIDILNSHHVDNAVMPVKVIGDTILEQERAKPNDINEGNQDEDISPLV